MQLPKSLLIAPCALFFTAEVKADPIFEERGGIVAMEAESTSSQLGKWKKKTDVSGYMGECHLEFTGNETLMGPPISPLKYEFTVKKGGVYQLTMRARKRLETKREDISNDCYISMKGNFKSGGSVPLKVLKNETKFFGGREHEWGWANQLDVSHIKYEPKYLLVPGEIYELTVHGRSKNFNIDRILLIHESVGLREGQKKNPKERIAEGGSIGGKIAPPTERLLTNKEGLTVKAKLISKNGNRVMVVIKGRGHELDIRDLSKKDQKFINDWQP